MYETYCSRSSLIQECRWCFSSLIVGVFVLHAGFLALSIPEFSVGRVDNTAAAIVTPHR
ncbi:hypothetical protein BJY04DRAFT_176241 [Aspergillus karnatakaensis]|uniref:uncharacterized protein n=1 Tax=Aspergillus karnatakaensis TaxID=1810916 RepID=UPI003CCCCA6D